MRTSQIVLLGIATSFTTAALAQPPQPEPQQPPTEKPTPVPEQAMGTCPEFLQGAKLSIENVPDGVSIRIVTQAGQTEQLRGLLRQLEPMFENKKVTTGKAAANQYPPLQIEVEDVSNGAEVKIHSKGQANITKVRNQVRQIQQIWQASACSTMQDKSDMKEPLDQPSGG